MNGSNLAKELSPDIFLLFPRETGEEGRGRVTGASENHTHSHDVYYKLKTDLNTNFKSQHFTT